MLHFIKRLFFKKPVKLYPVAGEKKRRIPYTNESILFILLIVLISAMSCTHKRHGEIIKTKDGKFYMLEEAAPNEAYFLKEIDTSQLNYLSK